MKPATERALSTLRSSLIAADVACFLNPVSAAASLPSDPAPSGRMSSSEGNQIEAAIPVGTIQYKLIVNDLDRADAFYRSVLDLEQFIRFTWLCCTNELVDKLPALKVGGYAMR